MDEDGFVGGEQRQPLLDPIGDVRGLSQRLREVDKTGDASLVDHHVGSMQVTVDEDGFGGGEQREPLLDPIGDVREQARVMAGQSPNERAAIPQS